jgi:LmbE family N-acetylglucosaminyl deacetylase
MLRFAPTGNREAPLHILCLGAHSDDIEIGCGATLLTLRERYPRAGFTWVVFSASGERAAEARASAAQFLPAAPASALELLEFQDGYFPFVGAAIKDYFEGLKQRVAPDLIFTHYRDDRHQDHRLIHDLTWNTFREHTILEYEIAKYDGDLGQPNVFVHLDEAVCRRKLDILMRAFQTQASRPWFKEDTFWALLRLRGLESRAPQGLAEAFVGRKLIL